MRLRKLHAAGGGVLSIAFVVFGCATGLEGAADALDGAVLADAGSDANVGVPGRQPDAGDAGVESGGPGPSCTSRVLINEVMTAGADPKDEFVELWNPNSCAVSLSKWALKYESATGGPGAAGVVFGANVSIPAGGYFVAAGLASTPRDVALTPGMAADKGQVGLVDTGGNVIDAVAYGAVAAGDYREGASAPAPASGGSIGRAPNAADTDDNASDFTKRSPSPGKVN